MAIFCNVKTVGVPFICRRASVGVVPVGVIPNAGGEGFHYLYRELALGVDGRYRVSGIFSDGAGSDWILLEFSNKDGQQARVYFDVANGTKGTESGTPLVSASITSVGGGEYQCSVTIDAGSSGNTPVVRVYNADADGDNFVIGNGSTIWHYQRDITVVAVGVDEDILDSEDDFSNWTLFQVTLG